MNVTTRTASAPDLALLSAMDSHLAAHDLAQVVSVGRVMVAEVDGVAVACLRWGLLWDQVPFMHLLWVVEAWRGRGVGTRLIGAWERVQEGHGHGFVLVSTSSAERAQHLYRRLGYVDSGGLILPNEPTELILRKRLGGSQPSL